MILGVADPQSGSSSTWFLVELEFESGGFLRRGENPEYPEKNLSEGENQQQTQPTYGVDAGIEPAPHRWEASALTTVQSLAPHLN